MATLPGTGSAISFGQVNRVFSGWSPGAGGNADGINTNPPGSAGGGNNIKLSSILGAKYGNVGYSTGTQILFSFTFGGKTGPYS